MKINGQKWRTIWLQDDGSSVGIIDQTKLPHDVKTVTLRTVQDAGHAIRAMQVRGAPLIGATAAYGMALASRDNATDAALAASAAFLKSQRPTAVNLRWAVDAMMATLLPVAPEQRAAAAYQRAHQIVEDDVETCRDIGGHGLSLLRAIAKSKGGDTVNVLTHCNAGWLACIDWGTATSPIYHAHDDGVAVHVFVDETRPRNQGAALTAFELSQHGVPHSLIVDNAGGHFMQSGDVDIVIVGTDRVTANGDCANKIGTYLKALAAHDNNIPFYVALPFSTIDWDLDDGRKIEIEERDGDEVLTISGRLADGTVANVRLSGEGTRARNPGFDVTPARLITGFITERGICPASRDGLISLYPERQVA